jgi:hypothetical protein
VTCNESNAVCQRGCGHGDGNHISPAIGRAEAINIVTTSVRGASMHACGSIEIHAFMRDGVTASQVAQGVDELLRQCPNQQGTYELMVIL